MFAYLDKYYLVLSNINNNISKAIYKVLCTKNIFMIFFID